MVVATPPPVVENTSNTTGGSPSVDAGPTSAKDNAVDEATRDNNWLPPVPRPHPSSSSCPPPSHPQQQQSQGSSGMSLRWKHARTLEVMQTCMKENAEQNRRLMETLDKLMQAQVESGEERRKKEEMSRRVTELEEEAATRRADIGRLEKDVHEARASAVFVRQVSNLSTQVDKLKIEKEEAKEQLGTMEGRLEEQKRVMETLKSEKEHAEERAMDLKRAYGQLENDLYEKIMLMEKLESDLRASQRAQAELQKEKDMLSLTRNEKDRLLEEEVEDKLKLHQYVVQMQEEATAYRNDMRAALEEKERLYEESAKVVEEKEQENQRLCQCLEESRAELQVERGRYDRLVETSAADKAALEERLEDLQCQVNDLTNQLKGRSHFAEFIDMKIEKKQLEGEVDKLKVSQEKLLRALATEKQATRRLSGSGSVASMSSSFVLRDSSKTILVPGGAAHGGAGAMRVRRLGSMGSLETGEGGGQQQQQADSSRGSSGRSSDNYNHHTNDGASDDEAYYCNSNHPRAALVPPRSRDDLSEVTCATSTSTQGVFRLSRAV